MCLGGLDVKHQCKSGRNEMARGSTVCPNGGNLVTNMHLFEILGVPQDCIRVKDLFADWRVDILFKSLPDFPMLLDTSRPLSEIIGTQLYFMCYFLGQLATNSKSPSLTRRTRVWLTHFAVQVLSSWKQSSVTLKNLVCTFMPMAFLLTDGDRWTLMITSR